MNHPCDSCKQREGIVRIAQSRGSKAWETWLCDQCSRQLGVDPSRRPLLSGVGDLISGVIDRSVGGSEPSGARRCPRCSTSFKTIRTTGKVGCSDCYTAFGSQIMRVVKSLVGAARHTGKFPDRLLRYKRAFVDRERLRRDLDDAVGNEDYERAAEIRDSLKSIDQDTESDDAFLS